ncbi:AAA-like domain-containing protein [candidate division KSB1 bacterium]|nr:AAA-like domain-containing protein [candidate division KSB1 bacterium]
MSRCFISYRHVNPDEELAVSLQQYLHDRDHQVFVDNRLLVGAKWAEVIDKQIRASEFFIVLLSAESIKSDMVRQEVKLAHQLSQRSIKPMRILPIRVDFAGELPYDLGAYLDRIQYALWRSGESYAKICAQVLAAIEEELSLPLDGKREEEELSASGIQELFETTEGSGQALPAADPRFMPYMELESGTMQLDSPFYIRRASDAMVESRVVRQGCTIIIKAPRQMGKSSLLARAKTAANKSNIQACYIDFQMMEQRHLNSLETCLEHLARKIAKSFKVINKPEDYWDKALGAKESLTDFIEDALLANSTTPILILMDEVDQLFGLDYRDDFFALIRGWHNSRAINAVWNNFNLAIAHSTEPYLWIQNINQSPFNVGTRIQLQEFTVEQVAQLNRLHSSVLKDEQEIKELIDFVGGQPYLLRQALYALVNRLCSFADLFENALLGNGPFRDHLRRLLWCLQQNEVLKKSLRQIIRKGQCEDEMHFQMLRAAGLIKGESRINVDLRCRLYEEFFRRHL